MFINPVKFDLKVFLTIMLTFRDFSFFFISQKADEPDILLFLIIQYAPAKLAAIYLHVHPPP